MATYASSSGVPSDRSRSEIERTLKRYGATQFAYGWSGDAGLIGFTSGSRQVRFTLPLPDPDDREFTHTPSRGTVRSVTDQERVYQQAVRQRWRALALVVKAKLEAVEAGISTFEIEFGMHMVLPDGRTVADHVVPAIDVAYATGQVPQMLALGDGRAE